MVRMKDVSLAFQKGVTPPAWKAIKDMQRSLEIRGYQHYDKLKDAFRTYPTEALVNVHLPEAKRALRSYWNMRLAMEGAPKILFQLPWDWSEDCMSVRDPAGNLGTLYPNEATMQLLVLLTESVFSRDRNDSIHGALVSIAFKMIDCGYDKIEVNKGQLVGVLHPDVFLTLVTSLTGQQLNELLIKTSKFYLHRAHNVGLVEKIAVTLGTGEINRLAAYIATNQAAMESFTWLCNSGIMTREVAMRLFMKMDQIAKDTSNVVEEQRRIFEQQVADQWVKAKGVAGQNGGPHE